MVLKILAVVAEWERRRISERTAAAVRIARQNGKAANGFAGYGFRLIGPKGHKRRVTDIEERASMRRIVKSRCDGCSWEAIYFEFLKLGIRTREGKEWSLSRIYRAFQAELRLMAKEANRNGSSDASPPPLTTGG
jgi:DNA invertase Pin-like site-specific DNA recombinase